MHIRTATRIAIVGVSLALLIGILRPLLFGLMHGMTNQQYAFFMNLILIGQEVLGWGGVLLFLVVLSAKQKEQA